MSGFFHGHHLKDAIEAFLDDPSNPEKQAGIVFLGRPNIRYIINRLRSVEKGYQAEVSQKDESLGEVRATLEELSIKNHQAVNFPNLVLPLESENNGTHPVLKELIAKHGMKLSGSTNQSSCRYCRWHWVTGSPMYMCDLMVKIGDRSSFLPDQGCKLKELAAEDLEKIVLVFEKNLSDLQVALQNLRTASKILQRDLLKKAPLRPALLDMRLPDYFEFGDRVALYTFSAAFTRQDHWCYGVVISPPGREYTVLLDLPLVDPANIKLTRHAPFTGSRWTITVPMNSPFLLHAWELDFFCKTFRLFHLDDENQRYTLRWTESLSADKSFIDNGGENGKPFLYHYWRSFDSNFILGQKNFAKRMPSVREAAELLCLFDPRSGKQKKSSLNVLKPEEVVDAYLKQRPSAWPKISNELLERAKDVLLLYLRARNK